MSNYLDCPQLSKEWHDARRGCVTSSRIAAAISFLSRKSKGKAKGDETEARANLKLELVSELSTGDLSEHYVSKWMDAGRAKEPLARAAYDLAKGVDCEQVGFVFHPRIKMAGASPDGLIGRIGMAEFKAPKPETHIRYLLGGVVPKDYRDQMMWQLACDEDREWNDFASYCPEMKNKSLRLFIVRMYRDEERIRKMEQDVIQFNAEVQEMLLRLNPNYIEEQLAASLAAVRQRKAATELESELYINAQDCIA